jgi:hypothetical protein
MESNVDELIRSSGLPRHDRWTLTTFITAAIDPLRAKNHLLIKFLDRIIEFLAEWKQLVK